MTPLHSCGDETGNRATEWQTKTPDWSRRQPHHREGQCLTEYDPLTGDLIGDGYIHYEDEDEWL